MIISFSCKSPFFRMKWFKKTQKNSDFHLRKHCFLFNWFLKGKCDGYLHKKTYEIKSKLESESRNPQYHQDFGFLCLLMMMPLIFCAAFLEHPFAASCGKVCFVLRMEMRGVEPLSENPSVRTSPITVSLLLVPQTIAEWQAMFLGSFMNLFPPQSLSEKVPRQVDAKLPGGRNPGVDSCRN